MSVFARSFFQILGMEHLYSPEYKFSAPLSKDIEFQTDGLYTSLNPDLPWILVETNFYKPESIYTKTITEGWMLYSMANPRPPAIHTFLIFNSRANDTKPNA
jgi:predicted transposase YdaD